VALTQFEVPQRLTRQPPFAAPIDWGNPITSDLIGAGYAEREDGIRRMGRNVSPTVSPTPLGLASTTTHVSNSFLTASRNLSPSTANGSFVVAFIPTSFTNNIGLFQTNSSTNFAGLMGLVLTTGSFQLSYGDGAGINTTTNRRAWATPTGLSAVGRPSIIAGAIDSSTVARVYHNGVPVTLTASGSTAGYSAGSTAGVIGRRFSSAVYGDKRIAGWGFWNRRLTDSELLSLSLNPWQLFRAPSRRLWVVSGAAPPATDGYVKVWNGSAWVAKPLKVWDGSAWNIKPVKHWNGSWQLSNGA
jgi:hypothetical protein